MKITPEASAMLKDILSENKADGLQAILHQTCCGSSPVFQMVRFEEGDKPEIIDGIAVLSAENVKEAIEEVIIDVSEGELVVLSPVCGCSAGCGGGCSEEGCADH